MTAAGKTPALLLILDGWGHSDATEHNAIAQAHTPVWDSLWRDCPHTLIHTSGLKVGLPEGQMGNSEVGHMNLGAGRVVYQTLTRINKDIEEGAFFANPVLIKAAQAAAQPGKALHLLGLLSPGGIHSHEEHFAAMIELARAQGCSHIYLHALLDGRDTPPRSAAPSLQRFEVLLRDSGLGRIASIAGRFYGMDRDKRWDRVELAFKAICCGEAAWQYAGPLEALEAAYERGENDEFVQPSVLCGPGENALALQEDDVVVFMNFRADRARELTQAFVDPGFAAFARPRLPRLAHFVMLTEYAAELQADCAYPPENLSNVLGEYVAQRGLTQLRIAETEKYAHVTFFFSGGREQEFPGETRILIPSPKVSTYDLKPEMSVYEVTEQLVSAIRERRFDLIVCNFANGDMVGHTGIMPAAIAAVEAVDNCLSQIRDAILEVNGNCLITADHGNVEQMLDENSGQPLTSHTTGPVPLVYLGRRELSLRDDGALSDVAPTLLSIMGLPQPAEMSGRSLAMLQEQAGG